MATTKVAFLTFYYEAWDALAEIHERMLNDPRFEVVVVAIPRRLTGDQDFDDASATSAFFDSIGVEHVVAGTSSTAFDLEAYAPDYVFINYPWQRNYQPQFRVENLARFTRVAYVPYYSLPMAEEGFEPHHAGTNSSVAPHLYTQRSHQLASLVFTQTADVAEAYAHTSRGNSHVHHVGSTKIDALTREVDKFEVDDRLTLVWAPHHSYSPHWLNFGVFAQIHTQMLDWARSHPELEVILRPHPFMFGTLVDRDVISAADLDAWRKAWLALPNCSIDTDSGAAQILAKAQILLTDGISFLAEYPLATGRPAIFLENQGHWRFTAIGELAAAACVRLNSFAEFADGFDFILEAGLPDRTAELSALRAAATPFAGNAATKIVEIVAQHATSGPDGQLPPLVDPSAVTETPWELQEGREPLID
jgi:hypothetical protein